MKDFIAKVAPVVLTITSPLTNQHKVGGPVQRARSERRAITKMVQRMKKAA